MNQRTIDLPLFWSAGQAATVLDYLDRLRDLIWDTYGEDIIALRTGEHEGDELPDDQCRFEFENGCHHRDAE